MKAFVIDRYKSPLRQTDVAEPEIGPHEVLVQVHAAGVNPIDERVRLGEFKLLLPQELPLTLGSDVAGIVIAVGAHVTKFRPGDEIFAHPGKERIGAFAERIAIAEDNVALRPKSLTMNEAGAVPLVALTAWQALVERGHVAPGHKVLIHAGSGGVGSIAIQLAKHLGATVATTVSGPNAEFVRALGADTVIDYRSENFADVLGGYDLVLDSLGGENLEKSMAVLKPGGKVIGIAGPPDPAFAREIRANPLVRIAITTLSAKVRRHARRAGVHYEFLFVRADGEQLTELARLFDSGALRPIVDRVFPFVDTAEALASLGSGGTRGKTVIAVRREEAERISE
ncbi:NADP-dependent oxidoreductase [Rhodococcus sp. 14C212]|uniref:NADP-dependent oxidoreductase n=1 Tax=Rhodococcus sp. 14C212 TaxID=2711209 RepID=UPI0013EC84FC|nr:NADP-dependent oxidoreductase [Rhodococcus sp. 14C212]NGP06007.1 NADP-dependent oxidoreductase [Rhodococcus sp. 14C212]